MKIALLGYGKMGQVIEQNRAGHEIILKKTRTTPDGLANADVAIDFSIPAVLTLQIV
jgi:4-hydroxy-tetrahydrodipicolinate reductase